MIVVDFINKEEWKSRVNQSYFSVFGESRNIDTITFALLVSKNDQAKGFVTCIEQDQETIYWQLGGAFNQTTSSIVPCYMALIAWCFERYHRITTRIENTNIRMLHLAMKMGFIIVGTWNFKNKIYLELLNERGTEWLV